MDEKYFKIFVGIFIFIVAWSVLFGGEKQDAYNVNIVAAADASEGLDLQAVGSLIKKAPTAEEFEKLLNDPGESINNLDLNEDGNVDYIKVTEYGEGQSRGMSLTVEPAEGEEQEVATIDIESTGENEADVEVRGNSHIYGHDHYYHSRFSFGDALLMSYLFSPHRYYMSPWGFGYYPSYYHSYGVMATASYRTVTRDAAKSSNMKKSGSSSLRTPSKSPNAGKTASSVKAPLKNPSTSQKAFQKRNPSKTVRKGGFGRSSGRASVRTASSSRGGGFFGGGK